ncbi:MAG: CPBP family glutamic-type intramembrane protease [Planctomycetota bacterium]|nr:CPBP family glutamic-type intramembrane protease [Planctomycetota bacterium]
MSPAVRDLGLRFGLAVLITALVAPFWGALFPDARFHRIVTRIFLGSVILCFALFRAPISQWGRKTKTIGLCGPDRMARIGVGAVVSIVLLMGLLGVSWVTEGRAWRAESYDRPLLYQLGRALMAGTAVAFVEEILCRGYLKNVLGGIASAAIYAGAHFFRPLGETAGAGGYDPLLVFKRFGELVEAWSLPQNYTLGFLSLFLFGLALNQFRERTGTLYFGIGIHAGLVFSIDLYRRFFVNGPRYDRWIDGDSRLHDGAVGTIALALLCLAAYFLPLPRILTRGVDEPGV